MVSWKTLVESIILTAYVLGDRLKLTHDFFAKINAKGNLTDDV